MAGDSRRAQRAPGRGMRIPPPPPPDYGDHYQPPPPPPPSRDFREPRPSASGVYHFGQSQGPSHSDFSFTAGNSSRPQRHAPGDDQGRRRFDGDTGKRRRNKQQDRDRGGRARNANGAGRGSSFQQYRPAASERKLLKANNRGSTPPQLEGMNEGKAGVRYVDLASDSEDEQDAAPSKSDAEEEPPKPKWSNPETYTALPPPDESQRKTKDMVKLIRKARVAANEEAEADAKALTLNDDFISLDFGNDDEEELINPGVPGAPTGPAADRDEPSRDQAQRSFNIKGLAGNAANKVAPRAPGRSVDTDSAEAGNNVGERLSTLKRKRGREDEEDEVDTRPLKAPNKSLKLGPTPDGKVLAEWQFNGQTADRRLAIPWVRKDSGPRPKASARLHQEIVDFYKFVSPTNFEDRVRRDLLHRLNNFMDDMFPGCRVEIFGSFAAGLYLPDADMDVVALSEGYRRSDRPDFGRTNSFYYKLGASLKRARIADDVEVIVHAKVPIIKFVDRLTSLKVDMSFENSTGIVANSTFQRWKSEYPAMPIIVVVIKMFLTMRGLNEVASGGVGGFSITCLVTSLLQNMPRVQTGEVRPEENLGEVLIEFLDLYGNRLNYQNTAIRMDPPGYEQKRRLIQSGQIRKADPDRIMIIDPNKDTNDISGGSRCARLIFDKFAEAKKEIMSAMDRYRQPGAQTPSLLAWMLGANYDSFFWYRRHLRRVHEDVFGPIREHDF